MISEQQIAKKGLKILLATVGIGCVVILVFGFFWSPSVLISGIPYNPPKVVKAQMGVIETALAAHRLDNLSYPSNLDGLVENTSNKPSWKGLISNHLNYLILGEKNSDTKCLAVKILIYILLVLIKKKMEKGMMPILKVGNDLLHK